MATDLGPLQTLPLESMNRVGISPFHPRARDFVESFPRLKSINGSATPAAWLARKQEIEELRKRIPAYAPKRQIELVAAKLMEFNPGFDGKLTTHFFKDGRLKHLAVGGREIVDISPLSSIPLTSLSCRDTCTADLSPLKGMRLTDLNLQSVLVTDLSPLAGLPLKYLNVNWCRGVSDLSPLRGMPLQRFECGASGVSDLGPMQGMPLTFLYIPDIRVSDLSLLKGMPLTFLDCKGANVSELSRLTGMPLTKLSLRETRVNQAEIDALRKALPNCRIEWNGGVVEPNSSQSKPWKPLPHQQQFIDAVAKLPAEEQVAAVQAKLREVNPGFDGEVGHRIDGGAVVEFEFLTDEVTDIWPLRGFPSLTGLRCDGSALRKGKLSDLSPLAGMPLRRLECRHTNVRDLSPLKGMKLMLLSCSYTRVAELSPLRSMPLQSLSCRHTRVSDLSSLMGMRLTRLFFENTPIGDLSPLAEMPLTELNCDSSQVTDLSPLKGMPLTRLNCSAAQVTDLSPLKGMPLTNLNCSNLPVRDLSPVQGAKLTHLFCKGTLVADLAPLRGLPLTTLVCDVRLYHPADEAVLKSLPLKTTKVYPFKFQNTNSIDEFWKQLAAQRREAEEFVRVAGDLPADERISVVRARLREIDPEYPATLGARAVDMQVTEATLIHNNDPRTEHPRDLAPLMAFRGLKKLKITGGLDWLDLSPLKFLPLESLTCPDAMARKNGPVLSQIETLKTINGQPAAEYWEGLPAKMKPKTK